MPLEVRQLVVKSTVIPTPAKGQEEDRETRRRQEAFQREILEDCRRQVADMQNDAKER